MGYSINTESIKDRRRYILGDFRGLDTASSSTDVNPKRSTYMRNLINRDGLNRKRYGWEEVYDFGSKVLGVYDIEIGNEHEKFKIYCTANNIYLKTSNSQSFYSLLNGYKFCKLNDGRTVQSGLSTSEFKLTSITSDSTKIYCFNKNEKAFIIGYGNIITIGSYGVEDVSLQGGDFETHTVYEARTLIGDYKNTYLPTIRINVNCNEEGENKSSTLDDMNVLNKYVKETCKGTDFNNIDEIDGIKKATYKLVYDEINSIKSVKVLNKEYNGEDFGYQLDLGNWGTRSANYYMSGHTELQTKICSNRTISYLKKTSYTDTSPIPQNCSLTVEVNNTIKRSWCPLSQSSNLYEFSNGYHIRWRVEQLDVVVFRTYLSLFDSSDNVVSDFGYANGNVFLGVPSSIFDYTELLSSFSIPLSNSTGEEILRCTYVNGIYANKDGRINIYGGYSVITSSDSVLCEGYTLKNNSTTVAYFNTKTGEISFLETSLDITPPIVGSSNIEVIYEPKVDTEKNSYTEDDIYNAKIATTFGANGSNNCLFLSKISNKRNLVVWSYDDDFTYFPDTNYDLLGSSSEGIVGFQKLSDSSLAIYKEDSKEESNLYIMSGTTNIENENTSDMEVDSLFISHGATISHTAINDNSFGLIGNDQLFVSKEGIYALSISDSISQNRYVKERSKTINNLLKNYNFICSIAHDDRFYASYSNGEEHLLFIADARFKYTVDSDMDDTYNFEWWCWDNCNVSYFYIENGILCFANENGKIFKFRDDTFADWFYDSFTISKIEDCTPNENGKFYCYYSYNNENVKVFENKDTAYVSTNNSRKRYSISYYKSEYGQNLFSETEQVGYSKCIKVLFDSNEVSPTSLGRFYYIDKNVVAEWRTPSISFGASDKLKTLFGIAIAIDSKTRGNVQVGYKTRNESSSIVGNIIARNGSSGWNLEDSFDYNYLSFDNGFESSYIAKIKERNFNYIQFMFRSSCNEDFAVNELILDYKYNTKGRGIL